MNRFDFVIIHFLNSFAHRSLTFDSLIVLMEGSNLLKGGIIFALWWWAWFRYDKPPFDKRECLLFAMVSSVFVLLVGRAFGLWISFRARPVQNPLYHFQLPYGVTGQVNRWSSMPSDHAVLFFCLAISLGMVSKRLGLLAACHALFIACLPRIYLGYHYPTDIIVGAVLGIAAAYLCKVTWLRKAITSPVLKWMELHPAAFYALTFLWTFEVAELFATLLNLQNWVRQSLGILPHLHV